MAAPIKASEQYVKQFFTVEAVADRPTSWELALHSSSPGTGDANEVSGGSYARQPLAFTTSNKGTYWEAENNGDVVFPSAEPSQNYTVTHYTIRDAATGEALATAQLPVAIPILNGSIISFPAGYIKVRGV